MMLGARSRWDKGRSQGRVTARGSQRQPCCGLRGLATRAAVRLFFRENVLGSAAQFCRNEKSR